jgi:chromosome segregation ATPase
MAATNVTRVEETDALASLEERILRAVQLVTQLRSEKEAAEAKLAAVLEERDSSSATLQELKAENAQLHQELNELRGERSEVRVRIEKLLSQMDTLAG